MSKERKHEYLRPSDARGGRQISYEGVAIEIVEINEVKNPFGASTYVVAYRVRDNRQAPSFVSQVAHFFANENMNLIDEFRKIRDHYEEIKSQLRS
jgi:hypothetical protein